MNDTSKKCFEETKNQAVLRGYREESLLICVFCVLPCPSVVCVPAYLMGARLEWHETKPEKRSAWCRLAVFSGSQMAWGAERKSETRGSCVGGGSGRGVCMRVCE